VLALALAVSLSLGQLAERQRAPGGGECLWWRDRSFRWTAAAPGDAEYESIDRALAEWRAKLRACTGFELPPAVRDGDAGVDLELGARGSTSIVFRQRRCTGLVPPEDPCHDDDTCNNAYHCWPHSSTVIAAPRVSYQPQTGELFDVDIEVNAADNLYTTVDAPPCPGAADAGCVWADSQSLMTSFTGYALGLAYVHDPASVMNVELPPGTVRRTVDAASAGLLCRAYPIGQPPTRCDGGSVELDAGSAADAGTPCNPDVGANNGCNASERCLPRGDGSGRYTCQTAGGCGCGAAGPGALLLAALALLGLRGPARGGGCRGSGRRAPGPRERARGR